MFTTHFVQRTAIVGFAVATTPPARWGLAPSPAAPGSCTYGRYFDSLRTWWCPVIGIFRPASSGGHVAILHLWWGGKWTYWQRRQIELPRGSLWGGLMWSQSQWINWIITSDNQSRSVLSSHQRVPWCWKAVERPEGTLAQAMTILCVVHMQLDD